MSFTMTAASTGSCDIIKLRQEDDEEGAWVVTCCDAHDPLSRAWFAAEDAKRDLGPDLNWWQEEPGAWMAHPACQGFDDSDGSDERPGEGALTADALAEQVRQHLVTANRARPVKSPPIDPREAGRHVASLAGERVRATTRLFLPKVP